MILDLSQHSRHTTKSVAVARTPQTLGSPGTQRAMGAFQTQALAGTLVPRSGPVKPRATEAILKQEEQIFNNLATVKIATSRIAMHMSNRYRISLFGEIDRLLSVEDWDDDSSLIDEKSFVTFLRTVIYGRISRMPSMGIANGRILASWRSTKNAQRLYVEFLSEDQVQAVGLTIDASGVEKPFSLQVSSSCLRKILTEIGFDAQVFDAAE